MTGFIDLPSETFALATAFWRRVTESQLSPPRGDDGEFQTLIPRNGDAYVRVQRTSHGPRVHLDVHVDSIEDACQAAERLGAVVDAHLGHVVMRSPTGFTFCFVSHHGESLRPEPIATPVAHRLDQMCIDVPAALFDREIEFWHALTGWELHHSRLPEFAYLDQPSTLPLRLLFQRLGDDDRREATSAHLDIACGRAVDSVSQLHEEFGAEFVSHGIRWTTMLDPAGMPYCLTQRAVATGQVPN